MISDQEINSYHASVIAEFFRKKLLIDNSADNRKVIIYNRKVEDDVLIYEDEVPEWVGLYLLDKL